MKRVAKPVFFIVAFLILFLTYTATFGIKGQNGDNTNTYIKGVNDIRWGIDINGGVEATFSPETKTKATKAQIDAAKAIIEVRMTSKHITDYELYTDYNKDRIIVRFPWKNDEKTFDPESAIQELSATAMLTFREGGEYTTTTTGSDGKPVYKTPKGTTAANIILQGSDIQDAKSDMRQDPTTGVASYEVSLVLNDSGTAKFADATERLNGQVISIWMDDVMISSPTVNQVISDGKCAITGSFTATEASALANKIKAGALPFKLTTTNFSTISPQLGSSALHAMLIAGCIAFALICIFMLFVFRLPGFVAIIALLGQIGLSFAAVSGYFPFANSFTMTLPGIAGIILSIGMGVDANIITASRIKEELWAGKTLDGAIQKGDENSFWAIFDGNITVIIVALILMGVFGPTNILSILFGASTTGSIYSFGYTLLIGIFGNFIFGVTATRLMTKSISGFKFARSKWLYGGAAKWRTFNIKFYENRKIFFGVSLGIIAVGLIFNVIFGTQFDIQFTGGAEIRYSYSGSIVQEEVENIVQDTTKKDVSVRILENIKSADGSIVRNNVSVSFSGTDALTLDKQKAIEKALTAKYPNANFEVVESSSVNPSMGQSFFAKCIVSILLASLLLIIYIAIRFKKIGGMSAGVMAVIALLHDVLMIYLTFIIFRMPLNENFIAVVLTILGYSLNDTIIIYDRIRENRKLLGPKTPYFVLVNTSINQTFTRSLYTAGCTFLAIATVYVVGTMFGLASVTTFALPMMVGILTGCYSSVCIAGPLYVMWQNHQMAKKATVKK